MVREEKFSGGEHSRKQMSLTPLVVMGSGWRKWCPPGASVGSETRERSSSGERGLTQLFQGWPPGRRGGGTVSVQPSSKSWPRAGRGSKGLGNVEEGTDFFFSELEVNRRTSEERSFEMGH